jgi:hypothetical protein
MTYGSFQRTSDKVASFGIDNIENLPGPGQLSASRVHHAGPSSASTIDCCTAALLHRCTGATSSDSKEKSLTPAAMTNNFCRPSCWVPTSKANSDLGEFSCHADLIIRFSAQTLFSKITGVPRPSSARNRPRRKESSPAIGQPALTETRASQTSRDRIPAS